MKNLIKIWLLLAVLAVGGLLCAAPRSRGESRVIIPRDQVFVNLSLTAPPRIGYDRQSSDRDPKWRWLRIDVEYEFNPSLRFKPFFTYDDMRVEIYMQVFPSGGYWRGLRWFSGTQYLYKVIPQGGKGKHKHLVSFFMPPGLIYNYSKRADSANLLKGCEGILFFYNGNRRLGVAFFDGNSSRPRQLEKKARNILAAYNLMQKNPNILVKDALWPREMTPWRYLDADRADLPRPNFNKENSSRTPLAAAPAAGNAEDKAEEKKNTAAKEEDKEEEEMKFTRSSSSKKSKRKGRR